MTVYVDDMYRYAAGQFGRMKMSHMIADDEDELHAMAARIGVARKWHQGDHYDVAISRRDLAIAAGAVPIAWKTAGLMTLHRRRTGAPPTPEVALAEHLQRMEAARAASEHA